MKNPEHIAEIFLQPGDFYFGDRNTRIRTLLGSCISITMWHPKRLIGGMCHYMLPARRNKRIPTLDGRYGEEAIWMFFREAVRNDTDPNDYAVKVFGGGRMFNQVAAHLPCVGRPCSEVIHACRNVSCRNAAKGISLLKNYGFKIQSHDLGGEASRNVIFDIWSGHVWVRRNPPAQLRRAEPAKNTL